MRLIPFLSIAFFLVPALCRAGELVMFETTGCPYCAAWDRDVGRNYAKTDMAARLPLRRIDIRANRPAGYEKIADVRLSPTFIVIACGEEIARIQGYGDSGIFWSLLDMAAAKAKEREGRENCGLPSSAKP